MGDGEQQLIERAGRGDRNAFARLYDRYAPLIRAVCFDLTSDAIASEDLAEDRRLGRASASLRLRVHVGPSASGRGLVSANLPVDG